MSPPEANAIETRVHAKINLALSVGPPIPAGEPGEGLHPICSWMACIDLADTLRVERLGEGEQSVFDLARDDGAPVGWEAGDDLAVRALRALETHAGRPLPARLTLRKSIPDGGGLGGGSGDAAAVLQAIDELFGLSLGIDRLGKVSKSIGSDVAFFLDEHAPPRPAIVSGLGDRIDRVARVEQQLTLVCPPFGCRTGAVYRAYDAAPNPLRAHEVAQLVKAGGVDPRRLFNDLAPAAERVEPALAELRARLADALGLPVHMSGSGSTLFVVGGADVAERARAAAPECRVIPTRLV